MSALTHILHLLQPRCDFSDEKTGEISVVAGLSRDGTPKRAPAKAENTPDFLRFDRNSDLMDSFFRNFFRQCKEPSR